LVTGEYGGCEAAAEGSSVPRTLEHPDPRCLPSAGSFRRKPQRAVSGTPSLDVMPLPKVLARVNRSVTNPVMNLYAGKLAPLAIVHHTGRASGRSYRTTVMTFRRDDRFVFALTYGGDVDWVKNLLATGGGEIEYRGERLPLTGPKRLETQEGLSAMPRVVRMFLVALRVTEFLEAEVA
jgi:deazaflavin-dependent oxidoreductase (nitroreductase family)